MTGVDLGDNKLKPCPFCGSDIVHLNKNKIGYHQVICYNLGCYANVWGATKEEAGTVLVYMGQANLIIKNENARIPNIESIFAKLEKMKGE